MAQDNIFNAPADEVRGLFGNYLSHAEARAMLAISQYPLGNAARNAVLKSLESFGYGKDACLFASILPDGGEAEGGSVPLDAQALFLLVEGLDPLAVICTDAATAALLSAAYRTGLEPDTASRLFGRPAVVFRNLEQLLETDAGKQRAWKLLKSLPRR